MSDWTVDTLREYMDAVLKQVELRLQQRFDAQQTALDAAMSAAKEAVATAMTAAEKATAKAELAADKRFESVNEFRETLTDQQQTFITRTEALAAIERNTERTQELATVVQTQASRIDTREGKSSGIATSWGILVGIMAVIGVVAGVVGYLVH